LPLLWHDVNLSYNIGRHKSGKDKNISHSKLENVYQYLFKHLLYDLFENLNRRATHELYNRNVCNPKFWSHLFAK